MCISHKMLVWFIASSQCLAGLSCKKSEEKPVPADTLTFEVVPVKKTISDGQIDEVSGIIPGIKNLGKYWTIEDSDRPAELGLIDPSSELVKKITVVGATNRDWEAIAIGSGPETGFNYIYIADIGDNNKVHDQYHIYRMKEPDGISSEVNSVDKISFTYPDGKHDAEALMIDRTNKDLYIITKTDTKSKLYRLAFPYATNSVNSAIYVLDLPYNFVTAADLSMDGKHLLVRTYGKIYYYEVKNQGVAAALTQNGIELQHEAEVQGEAICFAADISGYYTISEKLFNSTVSLNFYKKK